MRNSLKIMGLAVIFFMIICTADAVAAGGQGGVRSADVHDWPIELDPDPPIKSTVVIPQPIGPQPHITPIQPIPAGPLPAKKTEPVGPDQNNKPEDPKDTLPPVGPGTREEPILLPLPPKPVSPNPLITPPNGGTGTRTGDRGRPIQPPKTVEIPPQPTLPPPIFIITPLEGDEVVFCIDRSGSMGSSFNKPVVDIDGQTVTSPTKMVAVVIEMKKAISTFPESMKFNIVFWTQNCGLNISTWQPVNVPATEDNKKLAFAWIDANARPGGSTPMAEGCAAALALSGADTILLLGDGAPNALGGGTGGLDMNTATRNYIKSANTQNAVIHTFYVTSGYCNTKCRELMQNIAGDNNGQYIEVGS